MDMDIIKSKDNSKIKLIRSLNSRKNREDESAFLVEGIKFVMEAINEAASILFVLFKESCANKPDITEIINILNKKNIDYIYCDDNIFDNVAGTVNSQGILAVVNKVTFNHGDILNNYKFLVLCDRIQDPGNLGTIIRTAEAFGPAAVILNKGCADPYNSKSVRATAGALFRIPIIFADSNKEIINKLKNKGFKIISTVVDSVYTFEDVQMADKICIVIGNEGQGIAQEIIDDSDFVITIKMSGRAESLNASIAAGICIYEISKKIL